MKLSELKQAVNWCFNKFGDMEVEYIYSRDYNIRVLDTIQLSGGSELDKKIHN